MATAHGELKDASVNRWKWFPRRINMQIAMTVLVATAIAQAVMTMATYFGESAQPSHQRLIRKDLVDQLVEIEGSLDRDSLERAVERLFPPAMLTTAHEVRPLPLFSGWVGMAALSALTLALLIVWAARQMQERTRRPTKEHTEMLACIGHDLRIPITRLQLRAEFLDDSMRMAVTRDLDLMARLIDGALAHLREGRWSPLPSEAFWLAEFVERICRDFSDTGASVEFSATDRPVVIARSEDLERALNSLIDNAIKYGSKAHVRVSSRDDMAVIEVEDEGPGIPEGNELHLMEPFTRGDAARAAGGFGLGLSTAKAIAEDHDGYLRLTNSPRSGLLACFGIPAVGRTWSTTRALT